MAAPATTSRLIVILGPTAGGKSELAVALAQRLPGGAEVIGADSMQVYRGMDAGTAKPHPELRAAVAHHLIDVVEPTQRFTVADWLALAEPIIDGLLAAGRWPIVVGGTNLYIKALLEGLFDAPEADPATRAALLQLTGRELHDRLAAVDAAAAARIHVNDTKKLVRALEVHELTGQPISAMQAQWRDAPDTYRRNPVLIGLDWPVDAINRRINARVKLMFFPAASGLTCESLPDEVARLDAAGRLGTQAREALGYKQVLQAIAGQCSMDDAFEQTKIQTRRFAKRQRTWLKRFRGVHWLSVADDASGVDAAMVRHAAGVCMVKAG